MRSSNTTLSATQCCTSHQTIFIISMSSLSLELLCGSHLFPLDISRSSCTSQLALAIQVPAYNLHNCSREMPAFHNMRCTFGPEDYCCLFPYVHLFDHVPSTCIHTRPTLTQSIYTKHFILVKFIMVYNYVYLVRCELQPLHLIEGRIKLLTQTSP